MASVRQLITEVIYKIVGQKDYDKFSEQTEDLKGDLKDVAKNSNSVTKALGRMAKAGGKAGGIIAKAFGKAAGALKNVSLFGGIGVAGLGTLLLKLGSDAEEMESAFAFSFGSATKSVDRWAKETRKTINRSSNILKQASLELNLLFKTAVDEGDAIDLAKQFTVLSQDLASFLNLDPEDALAKLKGGLIGNAESLRSMNIFLNETEVALKAVELGLAKNKNQVSQAAKIQARAALILEKSTFAQGDAERTAGGFANTLKGLTGRLRDLGAELGKKLLPAATTVLNRIIGLVDKNSQKLVEFFGKIGQSLIEFVEGGGLQRLIDGFIEFGRIAGNVISSVVRFLGAAIEFIKRNADSIKTILTGIAIIIGAAWVASMAPVIAALTTITLIIAGIVGISKILIAAYDAVGNFFNGLFDGIAAGWQRVLEFGRRAVRFAKDAFKNSPIGLLLRGGKFVANQVSERIGSGASGPRPLPAGATNIGARTQTNSFNAEISINAGDRNGNEIGRDIANGMRATYRRNSYLDDLGSPDDA